MIQVEGSRLATYRCIHCQTTRPYGSGQDTCEPLLACATCNTPVRHEFLAMNDYTITTEITDGENRIQKITFVRSTRS